jgi:hypothetical protein
MFDLDQAIAKWRAQMRSIGLKSRADLDELESHLREQLDRAGFVDQKVFDVAVRQLGNPVCIRTEFKKMERQTMKRKIIIGVAILAFLFGTGIILPALARHNQRNLPSSSNGGTWATDELVPLCIGLVVTLGGVAAGINAIRGGSKPRIA